MLSERQKIILTAVVKEYTENASPVGSKVIVEKYNVGYSSATVRNEMMNLEKKGFLYQPHTSAGRIPTDKGYRYFVEKIMPHKDLSISEQKKIHTELLKLKAKNARLERTAAKLLAHLSGNLAISGIIGKDEFHDFGISELLEQPEFKDLDDFCRIAETLDYIDEKVEKIVAKLKEDEVKIFIGKENPIKEIANCSMLVSPYRTSSGEKGLLALIGPKRMQYAKNKSILEHVKKLLSGALVVIILLLN